MKLRELAIFKEGAKLARIVAILLWGLWLADIAIGAVLHHPSKTDMAGLVIGADYVEFHAAGQAVLEGKSDRLYARAEQHERQERIARTKRSDDVPFMYPPFVAAAFVPLALLPFLVAFAIYSIGNLALLRACLRMLGEPSSTMLVVMSWFPVFAVTSYGHFTFLTMALVAATWVLRKRGQHFFAGIVFGLSAYKPNLMLGVAFLFLLDIKRSWKSLVGAGISAGVLGAICFVLMPDASRAYVYALQHDLPALQAGAGSLFVKEHTLHVFWTCLLPGQASIVKVLTLLCQIAALAGFVLLWRKKPKPEVAFAAAIVLSFWLTPYTILYDISLLAIAAILLQKAFDLRDWILVMWFVPLLSVTILVPLQAAHLPVVIHFGELAFIVTSIAVWRSLMRQSQDSIRSSTSGRDAGGSGPISNAL